MVEQSRRTFIVGGSAALALASVARDAQEAHAQFGRKKDDNLQALLTPANKDTVLVDQNGNEFKAEVLKDKPVMVSSGFRTCSACALIREAMGLGLETLGNKDMQIVVFSRYPSKDSNETSRKAYHDSYVNRFKNAGIPPENITIVFAGTKGADGKWKAPDDTIADTMERRLMNNSSPGHSMSVFSFTGKGERIGRAGTAAGSAKPGTEQQKVSVRGIVSEARQALGITK